MNKISFDKAQKLWENLNTIESAFLGYTVKDDLNHFIEKMPQKPEYSRIQKPQENLGSGIFRKTQGRQTSILHLRSMQRCKNVLVAPCINLENKRLKDGE